MSKTLPIKFRHPYEFNKKYTKPAAYFSMEFAIDQSLKTYSGGLGFLAGSHMRSGYDLKQKPLEYLEKHFGNSGFHYYQICRGIHNSAVKPNRKIKSVGAERTFGENLSSEIFMEERLQSIAKELEKRLQKSKISGKTITLKIKYSDFTLQTRSKTLPYFVSDKNIILDVAKDLLYQERLRNSVRLLGISIHNLNNEEKTKTELPQKSVSVQLKFEF